MARAYFIPGQGYINETTNTSYFVPGWGYLNATSVSVSAAFSYTSIISLIPFLLMIVPLVLGLNGGC